MSLQALPYVCLLIAMLFFIYAIIGMQVGVCRAIARQQGLVGTQQCFYEPGASLSTL